MASGDSANLPGHLTYSKSKVPVLGALIDYMDTNISYIRSKTFTQAEKLHARHTRSTLSSSFMAALCLLLGMISNMKLEVMTLNNEPLVHDLHFMLLSKETNIYIEDIDSSGDDTEPLPKPIMIKSVLLCLEASDFLVVLISAALIRFSSHVRSPLSEYLYLPWIGAALRGLFLRQCPTAAAIAYVIAVVDGGINPLFLTAIVLLFLLEARLWLEVTRIVRGRWELRDRSLADTGLEVETLWSNEDVQSIEVLNHIY